MPKIEDEPAGLPGLINHLGRPADLRPIERIEPGTEALRISVDIRSNAQHL